MVMTAKVDMKKIAMVLAAVAGIIIALILLLVASASVLIVRRRTAVMQTATGETVTTEEKLTVAQVEDMIKTEAPAPSAELDRKVLSQIRKN